MLLLALLALVSQATGATSADVPAVLPAVAAVNPANFVFLGTHLRAAGDDVRLEGTLCRRANRSLLSPTRVQIDHAGPTTSALETSFAYLPRISQREDQRCVHFGTKLKSPPQPGDTIRVCLAQSKAPCPAGK